jgi:hypothetical protein
VALFPSSVGCCRSFTEYLHDFLFSRLLVLRSQPELKGKIVPIIGKWLRIPAKLAEEVYDVHHEIFAFPPRVGRKSLQDVLEIIQREP